MAYILALTLIAAPLYVWRFNLGLLPANFLLLWVIALWVVFIIWLFATKRAKAFVRNFQNLNPWIATCAGLFLLAGVISLLVNGFDLAKLGQYMVLFLQPLSLFFIVRFVRSQLPQTDRVIQNTVYILLAALGILALLQYFTLWTLPPDWWGNSAEPKRAIGFFAHANAFSLFLAPLLAWLIPDVFTKLKNLTNRKNLFYLLAWLLGAAGLLLSLSRGAWLGFAAALFVAIVVIGTKKIRVAALLGLIIAAIVIVSTPHLRYRLILPFQGEKSTVARFSLWNTGWSMVKDNPVLGQGLHGFNYNWQKFNQDPNLDHYNFPHNIFLNFWTDTGLLGLISFCGILIFGFYTAWKNRSNVFKFGLGLFLIALVVHGLIDIPYLKNDLAIVFWLIFGLSM